MARVLVVGAGIGGLACAWRLRQAGHDPIIVDRSAIPGGRMATMTTPEGFVFDVGAGLLPSSYSSALGLARDAGLGDLLEPVAGKVAVPRGGRTHFLSLTNLPASLALSSLIGVRSKLSLLGLLPQGLKWAGKVKGDDMGGLRGQDQALLADYARRVISPEAYDYIVEPTIRALYLQNGDTAAAVHFFWCVANLVAPATFSLKGGMDALARGLAATFDVRYGTEVLSVTPSGRGCVVETRGPEGSRSESFAGCVIALDGPGLRGLHSGGLTQRQQAYLANLTYSKSVNVHIGLKRVPASPAVLFQIAKPEDPFLAALVLDHLKGSDRAPDGKGMVSAFFMNAWSAKMMDKSDDEVARDAIARIRRFVPEVATAVEQIHVHRWQAAATMSAPGIYSMLADFVADIDTASPIQFCGDYFSHSSVNECVKQGERAAARLHAALGSRG